MAEITIDLSTAQANAEAVRQALIRLRAAHDLTPFEYTRAIRIAPGEIPHSHPVLTLNTQPRSDDALLSLYLHEQMHWYVTWYSHRHTPAWSTLWTMLGQRHVDVPTRFPQGAGNAHSSRLHLVVNWLEIEMTGQYLGRDAATALAAANPVYAGITRLVLLDWDGLSGLYREHALAPIRAATEMTAADLAAAARMEEAPPAQALTYSA